MNCSEYRPFSQLLSLAAEATEDPVNISFVACNCTSWHSDTKNVSY